MDNSKNEIKQFILKVLSVAIAIIVIINVSYNMIFADKLENLNILLSLNEKENIEIIKNKIREEIKDSLKKDKIINDEDGEILYKLYKKVQKELMSYENKEN